MSQIKAATEDPKQSRFCDHDAKGLADQQQANGSGGGRGNNDGDYEW